MQRLVLFFYLLFLSVVTFSQTSPNEVDIFPGTKSYRVDGNCDPTWTPHNMTSWDSSPYEDYHMTWGYDTTLALMNFRLMPPEGYDENYSEGYPMIVMMHGAGERGNCWPGRGCFESGVFSLNESHTCEEKQDFDLRLYNNDLNLLHGGRQHRDAVQLAGSTKAEDPNLPDRAFPGFVLFPQNANNWTNFNTPGALIQKVIETYNIDPDRIYIHGLSDGGFATYRMMLRWPTLFAAGLPMSATMAPEGNEISAGYDTLATHRLWLFQGGRDGAPTPAETERIIGYLQEKGGQPRYSFYPNLGHGTWNTAYSEPDFFSWMLQQRKSDMTVYYGDSSFCTTNNQGVRLGVSVGFEAYQWRKDGIIVQDSIDADFFAKEAGIYEVRYSRVPNPSESDWNRWSKPVEIKERSVTTPVITASGTTMLPGINTEDTVRLSAPNGFGTYEWYRDGNLITGADTSFYTVSDTQPGDYTVIVKSLDGCPSLESAPVAVRTNAPNTLPAPTNGRSIINSPSQITLNWTDNAANETAYEIYGKLDTAASYTFLGKIQADATSYNADGLIPEANYIFQIRAINNQEVSSYEQVNALLTNDLEAPSAPQNLSANDVSPNAFRLTWSPSVDNESFIQQYLVQYGSNILETNSNDTTIVINGLAINSIFDIKVFAQDPSGNISDPSNSIQVSTYVTALKYYHGAVEARELGDIDYDFIEFSGEVDVFKISDPNIDNYPTQTDFFYFRHEGYLFIENAGDYTFYTSSDDGSRLYVGGDGFDPTLLSPGSDTNPTLVVENDGLHGTIERCRADGAVSSEQGGTLPCDTYTLDAGFHRITSLFFERGGGQSLAVRYRGPDTGGSKISIPASALKSGDPPSQTAPAAPSSLNATAVGMDQIDLSWSYPSIYPDDLDIVVLGSSTAAGTGATTGNSWVELLDAHLGGQGITYSVVNRAQGGFTTDHILPTGSTVFDPLNTIDTDRNISYAVALDPDMILVNLPSNNVDKNFPVAVTMNHYRKIDSVASAHGIPIYYTTTQPRNNFTNGDYSLKRGLLEEEADSVRAEFGEYTVDIYDELTDFSNDRRIKATYAAPDGVHLNDLGHAYIFNTTVTTIERHFMNIEILASDQSGGPYTFIGATSAGSNAYSVDGLLPSTHRFFTVRAVNKNGVSTNSNEASATTAGDTQAPSVPQNVTASDVTYASANLQWDPSTDNNAVDFYEILIDGVLTHQSENSTFNLSGISPGVSVSVTIQAVDLSGNSSTPSSPLLVTTTMPAKYYLINSQAEVLSSWNSEVDGTGVTPPGFDYNGQTFEVLTNASISGDLTISGGVSRLILSTGTLDVNAFLDADIELRSGSTINITHPGSVRISEAAPSSTLISNGISWSLPAGKYGTVELHGNGETISLQSDTTSIQGDLVLGDGMSLKGAPNNSSIVTIGGDMSFQGSISPLSFDNRYTLLFKGGNHNLQLDSDYYLYGLEVDNGGVVSYSTTFPQNLHIGTFAGGSLVVNTSGTLELGTNNLVVEGLATINPQNETGQIGFSGGNLTFNSESSQDSHLYPLNTARDVNSYNQNLSGGGSLLLMDTLSILSSVSIDDGVLNSNGHLVLRSQSDNQAASIEALNGSGAIVGDITAERYMSGEGRIYRYIGSPVSGFTVAELQNDMPVTGDFSGASTGPGISSSSPSLYYYDESTTGWIEFPNAGSDNQVEFEVGRGYSAFVREASSETVINFVGVANQGDINFNLTDGTSSSNDGWNLVSNPYASTIEWGSSNWTKTGIGPVATIRDNSPSGSFQWITVDINDPNTSIAPGQAFWVQTTQSNPVMTATEGIKISSNSEFYSEEIHEKRITLTLSDGTYNDRTVIQQTQNAEGKYEKSLDAVKRPNGIFNLYSLTEDSVGVAINRISTSICTTQIPLQIDNIISGNYTIKFDGIESFDDYQALSLYDEKEKQKIELDNNPMIEFTVDQTDSSTFYNRFTLLLGSKPAPGLTTNLESQACEGDIFNLDLSGLDVDLSYSIEINGSSIMEVSSQTEETSIPIGSQNFKIGNNEIRILANYRHCNATTEVALGSLLVNKKPSIELSSSTLISCDGQSAEVQLLDDSWSKIRLYSDSLSFQDVETNVLTHWPEGQFSLSIINELGCESNKAEVSVLVPNYEEPIIQKDSSGNLVSNYSDNLAWYLNGDFISNSQTVTPAQDGDYYVEIMTTDGCILTSQIYNFLVTGLEMANNHAITLYPNPSNGTIYISGKGISTIESIYLTDIQGKVISMKPVSQNSTGSVLRIDLSPVPKPGLYLITINTKDNEIRKRIVISK